MDGTGLSPGQIKRYLKQLASSREQYFQYLGQLAYLDYQEGNLPNPRLQDACKTLGEIAKQVSHWEEELRKAELLKQLKGGSLCSQCGGVVGPGAAFCPSCGKPVQAVTLPPTGVTVVPAGTMAQAPYPATMTSPAQAAARTCPSCGGTVEEGDVFCANCGHRVAGEVEPPTAIEPPSPETSASRGEASASQGPEAPPPMPEASAAGEQEQATYTVLLACPSCGRDYDDPEASFCVECGQKLR
jgi:hypothetical protein